MIVYIEYVIIDNVIIDYLLLRATFSVTNTLYNKKRILLGSLFGAMVALLYPLTEHIILINTVVKLISGVVILLISNTYQHKRAFYINFSVFFLLTFLVGGALTGIFNLLNIDASSEFSIGLMFLPVLLIINAISSAIKSIYKNKEVRAFTYKVDLVKNGKTVTVNGFLDTGNALFNEKSPVIVCGKKLFFSLIDGSIIKGGIKKITVSTVNKSTQNLCFKLDSLLIYIGDKVNINSNVTIAMIDGAIGDGYDVILNPALIKGESQR